MKKRPKQHHQSRKPSKSAPWLGILFILVLLAACTPKTEPEIVEVTRVVTETVTVEGESVEVTRVVTETVVVETAPEEEAEGEPPSATGSEGDAGPLPPPPDDGPKVVEGRGSTPAADLVLETAVTVRGDQTNNNNAPQLAATNNTTIDPIELQKWCQLATEIYKKRCV